MDANSVSSAGGHDQCWASKIEWHVKSPWEWEGIGFYAGGGQGHERFERIPVAEWAGSDQESLSFIGKEFFRGGMDPVTSVPDSASGIVVGSLGGVVSQAQMDNKSCAGGLKLQYPLMAGKNHVSAMEGSGKHEENGIKGCWLEASGTAGTNDSNCFVGSEYNRPSNQRNVLPGLGGVNGNYHNADGLHRNHSDVISIKDVHGDNSLTCLKLGKRQYFEDGINAKLQLPVSFVAPNSAIIKKPRALPSSSMQPPRCQVEGCNVALTNAKEYHRRHKVCEMHSKSPQVIVLGLEQRFCQQCSRFHVIAEFDDAKRSCRRRLAGHNERRRKNSSDALANNTSQEEKRLMGVMGERFPYSRLALPCMPSSSSGRALSLLSSQQTWANSSSPCGDLSSRSSAALRELIAENRAQGVSFSERVMISAHCDEPHKGTGGVRLVQQQQQQQQLQQEVIGNSRFMPGLRSLESHIAAKAAVDEDQVSKKPGGVLGNAVVRPTLDLMQHSNSFFSLQTGRNKSSSSSSSSEEECEIWKSFEGTHIV